MKIYYERRAKMAQITTNDIETVLNEIHRTGS